MPSQAPDLRGIYTIEKAEEDIATLRGQVAILSEAHTQLDTTVTAPNTPAQAGSVGISVGGDRMYANGTDANVYDTGRFTTYMVHDSNVISSTSQVAVGQLGPIQVNTGWYLVLGAIFFSQGTTTATQAIRFTTTATLTTLALGWQGIEGASILGSGVAAAVTDDMSMGSLPANTVGELNIHGSAQFSSAGQVQIAARCVTSGADTYHLKLGSVLSLFPINTIQGS